MTILNTAGVMQVIGDLLFQQIIQNCWWCKKIKKNPNSANIQSNVMSAFRSNTPRGLYSAWYISPRQTLTIQSSKAKLYSDKAQKSNIHTQTSGQCRRSYATVPCLCLHLSCKLISLHLKSQMNMSYKEFNLKKWNYSKVICKQKVKTDKLKVSVFNTKHRISSQANKLVYYSTVELSQSLQLMTD